MHFFCFFCFIFFCTKSLFHHFSVSINLSTYLTIIYIYTLPERFLINFEDAKLLCKIAFFLSPPLFLVVLTAFSVL